MGKTFTDPITKAQGVVNGKLTPDESTKFLGVASRWTYVDFAGNAWNIVGNASATSVQYSRWDVQARAGNSYGVPAGRTVASADDLLGAAESLDEWVIAWRAQNPPASSGGVPWWLWLLGAWALSKRKGRR